MSLIAAFCKFHNFWRFSNQPTQLWNECAVNEYEKKSARDFKSGDESMNENFRAIYVFLRSLPLREKRWFIHLTRDYIGKKEGFLLLFYFVLNEIFRPVNCEWWFFIIYLKQLWNFFSRFFCAALRWNYSLFLEWGLIDFLIFLCHLSFWWKMTFNENCDASTLTNLKLQKII